MKRKLIIEIETPDETTVLPEEMLGIEDDKLNQEEIKEYRDSFLKNLNDAVVFDIKRYFTDGSFEDQFIDDLEELYVEGWESFDDYGIKIKVTKDE